MIRRKVFFSLNSIRIRCGRNFTWKFYLLLLCTRFIGNVWPWFVTSRPISHSVTYWLRQLRVYSAWLNSWGNISLERDWIYFFGDHKQNTQTYDEVETKKETPSLKHTLPMSVLMCHVMIIKFFFSQNLRIWFGWHVKQCHSLSNWEPS